jgi:hypothetical protein
VNDLADTYLIHNQQFHQHLHLTMATDVKGLTANTPPAMPFWWFIVQIVTCVLGLGIFIVACYSIHVAPGGGPQAFLLFDVSQLPSPDPSPSQLTHTPPRLS